MSVRYTFIKFIMDNLEVHSALITETLFTPMSKFLLSHLNKQFTEISVHKKRYSIPSPKRCHRHRQSGVVIVVSLAFHGNCVFPSRVNASFSSLRISCNLSRSSSCKGCSTWSQSHCGQLQNALRIASAVC